MIVRKITVTIVMLTVLYMPITALSRPKIEAVNAQNILQRGIALFADGSFAESRSVLVSATRQTADVTVLAQIHLYLGLNYAAENRPQRAKQQFSQALKYDRRIHVDSNRYKPAFVRLFAAVRQSMEGELTIAVDKTDVLLKIDGRKIGKLPHTARLLAGLHNIAVVSSQGELLYEKSIQVRRGQMTRLIIELNTPKSAPSVTTNGQTPRALTSPTHTSSNVGATKNGRVWTWIAGGSAAASAAVAIVLGVIGKADRNDACRLIGPDNLPCGERQQLVSTDSSDTYSSLYDSARAKSTAANIAWMAAGIFAVSAVVLYWLESSNGTGRQVHTDVALHSYNSQWGASVNF